MHRAVAWLCAPGDSVRLRAAAALLAGEGIEVTEPPGDDEPGVLIVPEEGNHVATVTDLSSGGRRRVVVVAVGSTGGGPWDLLAAGAADVLPWATDGTSAIRMAAAMIHRWHQIDRLATATPVTSRLVGRSAAWLAALRWLVEVARFSDASVLITGESGTGKELAARLVHALDPKRSKGKFVVVDCTTIVDTLSGLQMFGHERGAFTGADTARRGAFAEADGGVLFLDEIGELPLALQPELLRVLQERAYQAVGSQRWQRTDFRLVCATNRDLVELERNGGFRKDLLFRLSAATVRLPSLAERVEDIPLLARHFLAQLVRAEALELDPAVERFLVARQYVGNVRELRQLVTRMAIRHVGGPWITPGMVPEDERTSRPGTPVQEPTSLVAAVRDALRGGLDLRALKSTVADVAVAVALADANGNLSDAARSLGVTTRALQLRRAGTDGVRIAS